MPFARYIQNKLIIYFNLSGYDYIYRQEELYTYRFRVYRYSTKTM